MIKKEKFLFVFILIMLPTLVNANQGTLTLLAVSEGEGIYQGTTAKLNLEIKKGSGQIFIDSYPLTKLDTQFSTRYAKDVACNFLNVDCAKYDFFYTIRSDSNIIGGPSAGSAIALLTIGVLKNWKINEEVAITGLINSGGLIGPVGGLKEKIVFAPNANIKKILIPAGQRIIENNNKTIDLIKIGKEEGIEVVEVSTISEALVYFFNVKLENKTDKELVISPEYLIIMKKIATLLCQRAVELEKNVSGNSTLILEGKDLLNKGRTSFDEKKYYSGASFCFGSNLKFDQMILVNKKLNEIELKLYAGEVEKEIEDFYLEINSKKLETITDLQTMIIVKERILEAKDYINLIKVDNNTHQNNTAASIAYAKERLMSAKYWSNFFSLKGKKFEIDSEHLKRTCLAKISEAQERNAYVRIFYPIGLESSEEELKKAYKHFIDNSFEMCLLEATKAKANADMVIQIMGVEQNYLNSTIERKLDLINDIIIKEQDNGIFPIMGYSYYEYAGSLKDSDIFSAMLYAEYAIELSNLDIYFKNDKNLANIKGDFSYLWIFLTGLFSGILVGFIILRKNTPKGIYVTIKKKPVKNPGGILVRRSR